MSHGGQHTVKMTPTQKQTARMLYRDGWTIPQIAEQFGVSRENIWKMLKRRGEPIRPRHQKQRSEGRFAPRAADAGSKADRDAAGIIVTLRDQATGFAFSVHEPGRRKTALRRIVERIDNDERDLRLLCYSTPETIHSDLRGMRADVGTGKHKLLTPRVPEAQALGLIGRLDLLDPELVR